MAVLQDELIDLPHKRYGEYLRLVYSEMAKHVPPDANIIEIGARHDRGVISKEVIPHKTFTTVDKDPKRGDIHCDVLVNHLFADVILSTCLLHHTRECDLHCALSHLHAPLMMFSGPNAKVMTELFGDHQWHLEVNKLSRVLGGLGYDFLDWRPIGMSEPLCELLVIVK